MTPAPGEEETGGQEPSRRRILQLLQDVHDRALAAESFGPALKALEMIGREIGMWRSEPRQGATLAELIAATPDFDASGPAGEKPGGGGFGTP